MNEINTDLGEKITENITSLWFKHMEMMQYQN